MLSIRTTSIHVYTCTNNVYHRNNESIHFQLDIQIMHYDNILPYCTGLA